MKDPCELAAQKMREIRKEMDLTQAEVAEKVGISRVSIANIEIGAQKPTLETIYKFAIAFKKEVPEILPSKEDVLELEGISGKDKEFILNLIK